MTSEEQIVAHPTRWSGNGLTLETRVNVFGLKAFKAGLRSRSKTFFSARMVCAVRSSGTRNCFPTSMASRPC